jgi:hypothetical protein
MRRDYFDRYAASMPTLTALRQRSAWLTQARVNFLPTNTAVGHSTLSTGADPRVHGITAVSVYERTQRRRHDFFAGGTPQDLMVLTWLMSGSWRRLVARSYRRWELPNLDFNGQHCSALPRPELLLGNRRCMNLASFLYASIVVILIACSSLPSET